MPNLDSQLARFQAPELDCRIPKIAVVIFRFVAVSLLALLAGSAVPLAQAQSYTYNTVYSFSGTTGDYPSGGLIMDASGNLYGTTETDGTYGDGAVFELVKASGY